MPDFLPRVAYECNGGRFRTQRMVDGVVGLIAYSLEREYDCRRLAKAKRMGGKVITHKAFSGLVLMLMAFVAMMPLPVQSAEQTYKLGHMFARGSIPDKAANKSAEIVAATSKGTLNVVILPEGILGAMPSTRIAKSVWMPG